MTGLLQLPVDKAGSNLLNRPALAALAVALALIMAGGLYIGLSSLGEPTRLTRASS